MQKFKLSLSTPFPDFPLKVKFLLPNHEEYTINMTVHHKPVSYVQEKYADENLDVRLVMQELIVSWDLDDELTYENIDRLLDSFPIVATKFVSAYAQAIMGVVEKN